MEQSIVGKVLSNWAITPPMDACFSTRTTSIPLSARSSAAWIPATPPPITMARWVMGSLSSVRGVFLLTHKRQHALKRHLRQFLMVERGGKRVYFRYYDPRVLRVYLPTCNAEELALLFGPVEAFLCEAKQPGTLLRFSVREGALVTAEVELGEPAREGAR